MLEKSWEGKLKKFWEKKEKNFSLFSTSSYKNNQKTSIMSNSPNRANAIGDQIVGSMQEAAGVFKNALTGNQDMKKAGIERKQGGQKEYDGAQAADKAEAKGDEMKGNVKDAAGKVGDALGIDNNLRSEGQADKAQADVKDAKSQI